MTESIPHVPSAYAEILQATQDHQFSMASDPHTGTLLSVLATSKPKGKFLELGTGTGLSTSWILAGMDQNSSLESIDFDGEVLSIAREYLGSDPRLNLIEMDGEEWILSNLNRKYDFIFADTWHGKYLLLDEVLDMLAPGGIYLVDDMLPQSNWPDGHAEKAENFVKKLESFPFLAISKLHWATGIIIAVRIP